jgi:hypothetical protein
MVVFGVAYLLMNAGAFAITLGEGTRLDDFKGMGKRRPWQAVGMTIFLLSLVGMPPLAGFAGKFLLFGAAIECGCCHPEQRNFSCSLYADCGTHVFSGSRRWANQNLRSGNILRMDKHICLNGSCGDRCSMVSDLKID